MNDGSRVTMAGIGAVLTIGGFAVIAGGSAAGVIPALMGVFLFFAASWEFGK
jgi:hypothetical protein